jgi:hypothetical protein
LRSAFVKTPSATSCAAASWPIWRFCVTICG